MKKLITIAGLASVTLISKAQYSTYTDAGGVMTDPAGDGGFTYGLPAFVPPGLIIDAISFTITVTLPTASELIIAGAIDQTSWAVYEGPNGASQNLFPAGTYTLNYDSANPNNLYNGTATIGYTIDSGFGNTDNLPFTIDPGSTQFNVYFRAEDNSGANMAALTPVVSNIQVTYEGTLAPTPEPSTFALAGLGAGALVFLRRRR
jgi:hypothetical protein